MRLLRALLIMMSLSAAVLALAQTDPLDEPKFGDCSLGRWPLIFESPIFPQTQREWDQNEKDFAAWVLANYPEAQKYTERDASCYSHGTREEHMRFRLNSRREAGAGIRYVDVDWKPGMVGPQGMVEATHDPQGQFASLAIDRGNGSLYGWAIDYPDWATADDRAREECKKLGGTCQIVLRFRGGCGAYVAQQSGGNVYGWGTAATRGDAEARARAEAIKRKGTDLVTRVWGCNSTPKKTPGAKAAPAQKAADAAPPVEKALAPDPDDEAIKALNAKQAEAAAKELAEVLEQKRLSEQRQEEFQKQQADFEAARAANEQQQREYQHALERNRQEVEAANKARREWEAAEACRADRRKCVAPPPR